MKIKKFEVGDKITVPNGSIIGYPYGLNKDGDILYTRNPDDPKNAPKYKIVEGEPQMERALQEITVSAKSKDPTVTERWRKEREELIDKYGFSEKDADLVINKRIADEADQKSAFMYEFNRKRSDAGRKFLGAGLGATALAFMPALAPLLSPSLLASLGLSYLGSEGVDYLSRRLTGRNWGDNISRGIYNITGYNPDNHWATRLMVDMSNPGILLGGGAGALGRLGKAAWRGTKAFGKTVQQGFRTFGNTVQRGAGAFGGRIVPELELVTTNGMRIPSNVARSNLSSFTSNFSKQPSRWKMMTTKLDNLTTFRRYPSFNNGKLSLKKMPEGWTRFFNKAKYFPAYMGINGAIKYLLNIPNKTRSNPYTIEKDEEGNEVRVYYNDWANDPANKDKPLPTFYYDDDGTQYEINGDPRDFLITVGHYFGGENDMYAPETINYYRDDKGNFKIVDTGLFRHPYYKYQRTPDGTRYKDEPVQLPYSNEWFNNPATHTVADASTMAVLGTPVLFGLGSSLSFNTGMSGLENTPVFNKTMSKLPYYLQVPAGFLTSMGLGMMTGALTGKTFNLTKNISEAIKRKK